MLRGRFPAASGGGASVEGAGPTGLSRGAGRALAAECHTRGGSGGGGKGGGSGSSRRRRDGLGRAGNPGRGPRLSIARLLSDPRRDRACPGVLEKPSAGRGSHGAGARSAGGRARCGRERRGAPGLPLFEAGDPMRRARKGREIRSSGGVQRGWRTVRQRPEPGGGQQEAAAART